METNTITISLDDYNDLLKYKQAIESHTNILLKKNITFYGFSGGSIEKESIYILTENEIVSKIQSSYDKIKDEYDYLKNKKWYQNKNKWTRKKY